MVVRALTGGVIETESVGGFIQAGDDVMNQAYSKLNSAKVKDGLARRRAAGHYATGMVLSVRHQDGQVVPHPDNWPARERWERLVAMEMNLHGYCRTHADVSVSVEQLGEESNASRHCSPPTGRRQAVVSPEEWQHPVLLKHRATTRTSSTRTQHLLSGLVVCDSCGRSLNQKTAYGRLRLKCHYAPCQWFGRGIAAEVVRAQLIQVLRDNAGRLADEAQQASNATGQKMTEEQSAVTAKIAQLEALQDSGVPDLDKSLEALRAELAALNTPAMGPDWTGLAELIASPGVLERFPDKQLRPLLLEYVAKLRYVGNPREVEIVLKEGQR